MVDFGELLGKKKLTKSINPIEIFKNLNKQPGKDYLLPPQDAVLEEWHNNFRTKKDVIVKLHTGQGKTLVGLLMLQSSLNEGKGPALYVCPNNYLVDQIAKEARSFGIRTIKFNDKHIPQSFLNSEVILVCNCKKLFNGKSVFGVRGTREREVVQLGAVVIDDAHKCLEIIRQAFSITAERTKNGEKNPIYEELWNLFEDSLREQAPGTCVDIINEANCLMAVPFWTWYDKRDDVIQILSKHKDEKDVLFNWDLLKDHIGESFCIFSGNKLEIAPRLLPIDCIPSFSEAKRRILLSATLTDDAFLVKDMGISPESVFHPLSSRDVKYSGERLIVLPSLVDPNLKGKAIISWAQKKAAKNGSFGVVAITPSNKRAEYWKDEGAEITNVDNLYEKIDDLKSKIEKNEAKSVLVLVNEYDGVDLPGDTCRILILDSLPSHANLTDTYLHEMNQFSGIIRRQLAQRVEQGMGRAIRGSSDWCIVVVIGDDITNFFSEKAKRAFLSNEAQLQIAIGEDLIPIMKVEGGKLATIDKLVNQILLRDENWKAYYKERMSELQVDAPKTEQLNRAIAEREAEMLYRQGQFRKASETIQNLLSSVEENEQGLLFQLMATYLYPINVAESMDKQVKAHSENQNLFRPGKGITYSKVKIGGTRANRILAWTKEHESPAAVNLEVNRIASNLSWKEPSKSFEQAIQETGVLLGLVSERPAKKTGKGPDNLWHIQGKLYWLIECKNNIKTGRKTISKEEAGQLSQSIAWFKENYETEDGIPIIIHPAKQLSSDAFIDPFWVITADELKLLRDNIVRFYNSLAEVPIDSLSAEIINQKLVANEIDTESLLKRYLQRGTKQS